MGKILLQICYLSVTCIIANGGIITMDNYLLPANEFIKKSRYVYSDTDKEHGIIEFECISNII